MAGLKVIKASAGSGKTYTLTNEYIDLLLKNERGYRNILAVTFTNKATEEMKRRVVELLYSRSREEPHLKEILNQLLHDYSSFSISTIDSFFQKSLRAFAREIGRNSSYGVELDQDMVLSEAVDNMIINLDGSENSELLEWLIGMGFASMEGGGSWNIKGKLTAFASEIFKESYKLLGRESIEEELVSKERLANFSDAIIEIIERFEKGVTLFAERALEALERDNLLITHFKGGSRSPLRFFDKVIAGETPPLHKAFAEMAVDPESLVAKSTIKKDPALYSSILNCWESHLSTLFEELVLFYENHYREYCSAKVARENIHTLGLLSDVEKFVNRYSKEENVVLIPETTQLLNKIIDESDAPFIYEKIGTRIDHFMLDEFQDTSQMQWQNFKPLILESLAKGEENLIVGDVKQSIYRWRGSHWNLLNEEIYEDLPPERVENLELRQNWRSTQRVVEFNNTLFSFLAKKIEEHLELEQFEIYNSVAQELSPKERDNEGYIEVNFIERVGREVEWKERAMEQIPAQIEGLKERGYSYSDITFLVRSNSEGELLLSYLIKEGYPLISEESLLIGSSPLVRRMIALLKFVQNPQDALNNSLLQLLGLSVTELSHLSKLPLYQLSEEALRIMEIEFDGSETIFINSFLDLILEFREMEGGDLSSFIKWWDLKGVKKSIPAPAGQEALRVMTIHKAKGLGIPIVILPFFEIGLDHNAPNGPIIWSKESSEPYSQLPFIPIRYSKALADTLFEKEYREEREKAFIDNLNVAYVALTRAEQELIIYSPLPPKSSSSESLSVSKLLYQMVESSLVGERYSVGTPTIKRVETPLQEREVMTLPPFKSYDGGERLRLKLYGEEFFDESSPRGIGLIMHSIMERIELESDLERAIESALSEGILSIEQREEVEAKIVEMFKAVRERGWFSGKYRVYRELEILLPDGSIRRPDRVLMGATAHVIDFKFGKRRESAHLRQMKEYISLIKSTGVAYLSGYLWYPDDNEIIEL